MPTHTTITENQDGTFSIQVHDADALSRIQTMCDIIREDDDDDDDDERALVAAYAGDLYNVIGEALTAPTCAHCADTGEIHHSRTSGNRPCPYCATTTTDYCPNCEPHHAPCADCAALAH